ncbi:MAG: precorrin-2 C(20)-methyltransferase [Rhodospirillaceae bacterium]
MSTGTVYGLGVGPGDPELITLKALRRLQGARAVAYPVQRGESVARAIVAAHLRPDQDEIAIDAPMTGGESAQPGYDAAAVTIAGYLERGEDVAVLCEGDPLFYGSFIYLLSRLAGKHRIEVVPGVTSLTACAAALPLPLVGRDERLAVMPAILTDQRLREGFAFADSVAIVKVGRHFGRLAALIEELGLTGRAHYVERASQGGQRVLPLAGVDAATATYFAIILVFKETSPWR